MSSVCQSEKQHLDLSIVKLLLLALRHPDCKQNTEIDFACVLLMPTNVPTCQLQSQQSTPCAQCKPDASTRGPELSVLGPERLIGKLKVFKSAASQPSSSSGRVVVPTFHLLQSIQTTQRGAGHCLPALSNVLLNHWATKHAEGHQSSLYHPSLVWTGDNDTGYEKTKVTDICNVPNLVHPARHSSTEFNHVGQLVPFPKLALKDTQQKSALSQCLQM
ncbi:uncharacterized protein LOC107319257 isoform X1 [Coturnix japonica]|uniref:uncharacterized protein LOC107319257 isoform X1 n=1 Tax=Coturnix japonica TaxID=93934 RepID=UPI000777F273|nr:uncharacterized protein LOC107319257 isoform X1 [Coturnix japonica]XP_015729438.1 uncharacterized protein LOC107319257 isoform X1 [Coturnix japonica]XP_015729442.1 uncharacterized protein LOC107319257 isoform X1 [Coturnix japonica]XP_015729443.1 uncharacterized protein LOC107319257 isoform X1 [Coturnix japonica]XP_032303050.1 uncharacterized protein LOC107319257 isoform X1 [Coturnix japonica]XP_032303051.1 uncharacterized protein LOC107319257 isoform X1 [Coturnix japonica]XP_032303052.1 un